MLVSSDSNHDRRQAQLSVVAGPRNRCRRMACSTSPITISSSMTRATRSRCRRRSGRPHGRRGSGIRRSRAACPMSRRRASISTSSASANSASAGGNSRVHRSSWSASGGGDCAGSWFGVPAGGRYRRTGSILPLGTGNSLASASGVLDLKRVTIRHCARSNFAHQRGRNSRGRRHGWLWVRRKDERNIASNRCS